MGRESSTDYPRAGGCVLVARWLMRALDSYRRVMGYDPPWPRPSWPTTTRPTRPTLASPVDPRPVLRQPKPVHQAPHVRLPTIPLSGGLTWGERPWCWCGKTWTATPQGYAAAERHNDEDLPDCGEARRKRQRDRAKQKRAAIKADGVLAEQLRAYEREMAQREWARIKADPERRERERVRAREAYRRRRKASSAA